MYCKTQLVVVDNLTEEQRERLEKLAWEKPDSFIAISEGDESCPRELDFDDVVDTTADLGALSGHHVCVVSDGNDSDLEAIAISKTKGYFAGEATYII